MKRNILGDEEFFYEVVILARASKKNSYELKYEIIGVLITAFAILSLVSIYTFDYNFGNSGTNAIGPIGSFIVRTFGGIFGKGKYIVTILIALYGIKMVQTKNKVKFNKRFVGMVLLLIAFLSYVHLKYLVLDNFIVILRTSVDGVGGGLSGAVIAIILRACFGQVGTYIVLSTICLVGILLTSGNCLPKIMCIIGMKIKDFYLRLRTQLVDFLFTTVEDNSKEAKLIKREKKSNTPIIITGEQVTENGLPNKEEIEDEVPLIIIQENSKENQAVQSKAMANTTSRAVENVEIPANGDKYKSYNLPPFNLLQVVERHNSTKGTKDITETVKVLENTLESFGVKLKVTQVSCGPAITRYEAQPAPGVKVSKIVSLADDIALSLAAPHVRIEAPIPGKAAVGIEVPNKEISVVSFREVLETQEFSNSSSLLTVVFGKDIAGNPVVADLGKMPHLLIAGATGSGKSVCMNALITSLLYKSKPNELKFLMIDPKMVELTTYNGIPHLVAPVVTDAKKSATALRWMVNEMENRYALFATNGVKDIYRYNDLKRQEDPSALAPALPFIVILIDELADLMMVAPADVEDAICRLAQMARAAGIHLVVATQRPSVDVITGIIKANIPSRVAFAVSSQTDSRTILDMGGAEKLLGRGDMLFYPVGTSKPIRVQGVYVSDREVEKIVDFLKTQGTPEYMQGAAILEETQENTAENNYAEDELLPEAARLLIESGQASISMLQRRLHVGYTRAARLIDIMEDKGIVGGYEGSKPRSVLINWDDYQKMFGSM
ncbi:DNA translocase FtsK 4TM domain-containing protein [Bacillota bacterium LX-D]|nr:DNA translocase FtsK 4TM domain-containing protein [Bacillota bacterium LX-D]